MTIRKKIREIGKNVNKFKISPAYADTSCGLEYGRLFIRFDYIGEEHIICVGYIMQKSSFLTLLGFKKKRSDFLFFNKEEQKELCNKFKDRIEKYANIKKIETIERVRIENLEREKFLNSINFKE